MYSILPRLIVLYPAQSQAKSIVVTASWIHQMENYEHFVIPPVFRGPHHQNFRMSTDLNGFVRIRSSKNNLKKETELSTINDTGRSNKCFSFLKEKF